MVRLAKLVDWFRGERCWIRLAAVVIVVGAVLRFSLAAISHPSGDSCLHLSAARFIAENGSIPFLEPFGYGREVFWPPPLFHLIAATLYDLVSRFSVSAAEFAMKLVSPFFGSLTLPLVFLIVKRLFQNNRLAFFATFFVAFLPLHIYASTLSFIDSFVTFFTTAAIYLALERRVLLGAVFAGLSLSSKQNALFILPVFFYAIYVSYRSRIRTFIVKSAAAAAVVIVTGIPWFVRNFVLLGNPFWPFLYRIFGGTIVPKAVESNFSVAYLFNPIAHITQFYLEFFGVPSGSIASFSFIELPFMRLLLPLWLLATVIFFAPVIFGFFVKSVRHRSLLYLWLLVFFAMLLLYIMNLNMVFARLALPAIPAVAAFWALGFDKILSRLSSLKIVNMPLSTLFVVAVVGCAFAFAGAEAVKVTLAAKAWDVYSDDFTWIREHTPKDALVGYRGQCLSYNINRQVNYDLGKVNYVWVNQDFRLEPVSIVEPNYLHDIEQDFTLVYANKATGTNIYKRK